MSGPDLRARLQKDGRVSLLIRVQPKSPPTGWAGVLQDGAWKVRLAAVAEKGKANDELVRFLAAECGVPRAAVEIVAGATSQRKRIRITLARGR
jgi:hypothetical protein